MAKKETGFWIDQLQPLINEFKDGSNEPLDGDDVDNLIEIIVDFSFQKLHSISCKGERR